MDPRQTFYAEDEPLVKACVFKNRELRLWPLLVHLLLLLFLIFFLIFFFLLSTRKLTFRCRLFFIG